MRIPSLVLRQLYTFGSLENVPGGVRFALKNRLSDASLTGIRAIRIDGKDCALERVVLELPKGRSLPATELETSGRLPFKLRDVLGVRVEGLTLNAGPHELSFDVASEPFGRLAFSVKDSVAEEKPAVERIPSDRDDDYTASMVDTRRRYVEERSGVALEHVSRFSFDPALAKGNVENFTGVAQVPIGFAGPLTVHGEAARGAFLIPMATTEGTLVASYNRGMKLLNLSGGVTCTVQDDCMQRAPVFVFDSAREARDFRDWVDEHLAEIRQAAEATTSVGKLLFIDTFLSNKFAFLRFNFSTGDAAGQNMVGRATFAACSWILEQIDTVRRFYLESNLATDKKASQVNVMRTRGKRVTAEAVVPRDVLSQHMRVEPEALVYHNQVANVGSILSGANNNGAHSPNGITALFIATGQDVANVSESSAGIFMSELTPRGDLYLSITIPSLIVGTHGGGTGLPTQRECLAVLGCVGRGKVHKLAEIVAAVVLAGEISLGAAISSLDWVSSHEKYGRNR
jgi:hydroxymethylglutaryl-CoA reductase (NADPH)